MSSFRYDVETGFRDTSALRYGESALGPAGPFPAAPLTQLVDRRWLHYAFLSRDGTKALVANAAWLGPAPDEPTGHERFTTILTMCDGADLWCSSQFNASIERAPWSAFTWPEPPPNARDRLTITAASGVPSIELELMRTSRSCTSQCAFFGGDQHLRWQSQPGVRATGLWTGTNGCEKRVELVGYHERVRGRWDWPTLGEWVFGFANDLGDAADQPPAWAGVFTFIRPELDGVAAAASFMLWRAGRLVRHFPRRNVSIAVRGELDRDLVSICPPFASLLGVESMAPVPRRLIISARLGGDWAVFDFDADSASRIIIPSEISVDPFSVHEVVGDCLLTGCLAGERFRVETRGIVEFSGGAGGD